MLTPSLSPLSHWPPTRWLDLWVLLLEVALQRLLAFGRALRSGCDGNLQIVQIVQIDTDCTVGLQDLDLDM